MFADPLVLGNNEGTPVDSNFTIVGFNQGDVSRIADDTTPQTPRRLVIRHATSGSGDSLSDRHLIQLTERKLDTNGLAFDTIVNLTITQSRRDANNTTVENLLSYLKDLLTGSPGGVSSAVVADIVQGQG